MSVLARRQRKTATYKKHITHNPLCAISQTKNRAKTGSRGLSFANKISSADGPIFPTKIERDFRHAVTGDDPLSSTPNSLRARNGSVYLGNSGFGAKNYARCESDHSGGDNRHSLESGLTERTPCINDGRDARGADNPVSDRYICRSVLGESRFLVFDNLEDAYGRVEWPSGDSLSIGQYTRCFLCTATCLCTPMLEFTMILSCSQW